MNECRNWVRNEDGFWVRDEEKKNEESEDEDKDAFIARAIKDGEEEHIGKKQLEAEADEVDQWKTTAKILHSPKQASSSTPKKRKKQAINKEKLLPII